MQITCKNTYTGRESAADIFATLLHERGFDSKSEIDEFVHPKPPVLKDILAHIDVDKKSLSLTKKLVSDAIHNGEDICVFGDYDADGVTSTAIMWQTIMGLAKGSSARIMPFIPDRTRHGYGLSAKAVEDIMGGHAFAGTAYADFHPSLLITVDNGIVAHDRVQDLVSRGVKVIITDHHQPESSLPSATAIVHSTGTSGAGIAWLLSLYLTDENPAVEAMVDIATIGIVADQIPLTGINRRIVVTGLKALNSTQNLGLKTMFELAGIGDKQITVYEINYVIAPRINAVGRLDNPLDALRLLCSRDRDQLRSIAVKVEEHNANRQKLTDEAIVHALSQSVEHNIVVAASDKYHEGIIGLVASKLAEKHNRPAIVISVGERVSKGSARSIGDIDVTAIMREHRDMLIGVGGHKLAGGLSIETARIGEFIERLYNYADKVINSAMLEKKSEVEGELRLSQLTKSLAVDISRMEPFGMGNSKPRFLVTDVHVLEDRKIGKDGRHRKLVIEQDGVTRDVIWFNGTMSHPLKDISKMICTAEINVWRDRASLQLNAQYVETD